MITTKLSAFDTSDIEIRPIEFRDEAYGTVNEHHFAVQPLAVSNISSGLREGTNLVQLVVTTCSLPERIRRGLADKDWCGRSSSCSWNDCCRQNRLWKIFTLFVAEEWRRNSYLEKSVGL